MHSDLFRRFGISQPEVTVLAFAKYGGQGRRMTVQRLVVSIGEVAVGSEALERVVPSSSILRDGAPAGFAEM